MTLITDLGTITGLINDLNFPRISVELKPHPSSRTSDRTILAAFTGPPDQVIPLLFESRPSLVTDQVEPSLRTYLEGGIDGKALDSVKDRLVHAVMESTKCGADGETGLSHSMRGAFFDPIHVFLWSSRRPSSTTGDDHVDRCWRALGTGKGGRADVELFGRNVLIEIKPDTILPDDLIALLPNHAREVVITREGVAWRNGKTQAFNQREKDQNTVLLQVSVPSSTPRHSSSLAHGHSGLESDGNPTKHPPCADKLQLLSPLSQRR